MNRLVYFSESLSTFSTGYLLPSTETSYQADVQAIYDASCATTAACHTTGGIAPLDLTAEASWFDTVNQPATESPKDYVVPGDPGASFLFDKITGAPGSGTRMPLDADPLPDAQIETIRRWILEGAQLN
jgi:mono/diheme cytochrome c family protein